MIQRIDGKNELANAESAGDRIEEKFVDAICELVADALNIRHREKRNFVALLKNNIEDKIKGSDKFLEQYFNNELRKTLPRFKNELDLPDDIDIVESHASHAKLSIVIEAIKEKYGTELEPENQQKA